MIRFFFAVFLTVAASVCQAADAFDRTPAYFVDRYGSAKSSSLEKQASFVLPGVGVISLKGEFSVREFRKDRLRVKAVFRVPELTLAGVVYYLPNLWTQEQVDAALEAFGGKWEVDKSGYGRGYVAPDGARAIHLSGSLHFISAETYEALKKEREKQVEKRKAVPKF
jgi:hypothetical protein